MTKENVVRICDLIAEYCIYGLIVALAISGAAIEVFSALAVLAFIVKKILIPDFSLFKVSRFSWVSLLLFTFLWSFYCLMPDHILERVCAHYFPSGLRMCSFSW
ncbi:MAG: hypothetical protein A4E56_01882 [Pelotomaculum sp. PtaU1.Bin065]|nr:MAG: hypothetical protein A4E56_01882 [Pelotomaculum sp. PtaU1.Bin065]